MKIVTLCPGAFSIQQTLKTFTLTSDVHKKRKKIPEKKKYNKRKEEN